MSNPSISQVRLTKYIPLATQTRADQSLPLLMRGLRWLDSRSLVTAYMAGSTLIVCIGIVDYITGPQINCSLFYLIPSLLVARVAGFRPGFLFAFLAVLLWLILELHSGLVYSNLFIPYWNALMRFGTFMIAMSLVAAMRTLTSHLEERVHERTAALEAQITETRELEKNILEISDRERATIGQDLHDGLCQQLVSAAFSTNMLQEKLARSATPGATDVNQISDMIDDAITQARNLARGLYPVRLETEGLEMALRELASVMSRRFEVSCTVTCPLPLPQGMPNTDIHLYRIAQEALINAAKHANAKHISLSLLSEDGRIKMGIVDDGMGIANTPHNPDGMGLRIMAYRARMIGAGFRVLPLAEGGTQVICELDG